MSAEKTLIRLLLVDDEADFLDATARALTRRGFAVEQAQDGESALALLRASSFDAVILDIKMPGKSGLEVYREIAVCWPALPVIILTGHATLSQSVELSRTGVFQYLPKPCDVDTLAEAARRASELEREELPPVLKDGETPPVRLLLVDDEEDLLDSLSRTLGRRGMLVSTAGSGLAALSLLDQQVFDVAVLDVRMPGMDGVELLEKIKARHPHTEVILLTGQPTLDLALSGLEKGAFDYLLKPQAVEALALTIVCAYYQSQSRGKGSRK